MTAEHMRAYVLFTAGAAIGWGLYRFSTPLVDALGGFIARKLSPVPPADPRERKRRSKLENERLKLTASLANSTAIAILVAVVVLPIFRAFGPRPEPINSGQLIAGGIVSGLLHVFGLWMLRHWRVEE